MKRGVLLALLAGLVGAVFVGPTASAQYPPPCNILEVDATVKVGGNEITVHVCGVRFDTALKLGLQGTNVSLTLPVDRERVTARLPVPANLAPGTYTLVAEGIDQSGKPVRFEVPITVVDPKSPVAQALVKAAGPAVVAPVGSQVAAVPTQVKGVQLAPGSRAETPLAAASEHTPAGLKFAGLSLLGLLALSGLGALGYTAFARLRR